MEGNTGIDVRTGAVHFVGVIELLSVAKSAQYTFAGELIYLTD